MTYSLDQHNIGRITCSSVYGPLTGLDHKIFFDQLPSLVPFSRSDILGDRLYSSSVQKPVFIKSVSISDPSISPEISSYDKPFKMRCSNQLERDQINIMLHIMQFLSDVCKEPA
ncbi:hypothetical protein L2E82_06561 [Cichorium intybus]|uniref:Uncharacterized protein n=1 Tax=Cichorium intybus TaxID=13427 RepID=A0ACB9HB46_CICIN|nr:hypothetical protein L2E82_06561 [Cichorium intybus]